MNGYILKELCHNPCHNLAYEECLVEYVGKYPSVILYLWQNDKTIVIGRNQDRDAECNMKLVRENEIMVVRRKTGGGAVYHDLGNLNFSIILPRELYDVKISTNIIVSSLKSMGIDADANERNDILANGRKISGNAYFEGDRACLHHGTIMYDVDIDTIVSVLTPSKEKLRRNKVASLSSRVVNIKELNHSITLDDIQNSIIKALKNTYKYADYVAESPMISMKSLAEKESLYQGAEWNQFGDNR